MSENGWIEIEVVLRGYKPKKPQSIGGYYKATVLYREGQVAAHTDLDKREISHGTWEHSDHFMLGAPQYHHIEGVDQIILLGDVFWYGEKPKK